LLKSAIARAARSSKSLPTKAVISPIKLISTRFVIDVIWGGRGGRMLSGGGKTSAPKHALNHELGPTIRGWRGEGKTSQESMLLRSRSSRNLALNSIRPAGI
jgi:hypothetical protein